MPESHLITGPMWANKTTRLISLIETNVIMQKKCLVVLHAADKRYNSDACLQTHLKVCQGVSITVCDGTFVNVVRCSKLSEINNDVDNYDSVFIDEGHFFPDICEFFQQWFQKINIYISALNSDYKNEVIPSIALLSVWVDKVKRLAGCCAVCTKASRCTQLTITAEPRDMEEGIGGAEKYQPVCLGCYLDAHSNKVIE
ncbi:hypothetical protein KDA11_04425 [Candidatus Saccharibacteria bacterium]|nr:hypothetical protein [Candidatus Saccharibacteria bacterium]